MKPATEIELAAFELIQQNRINDAFTTIAKYESQQEWPRGINVPWAELAKNGLSKAEQRIYLMAMSVQLNMPPELIALEDNIRSISILVQMLGKGYSYTSTLFLKLGYKVEPYEKLPKELRFEIHKAGNKIIHCHSSLDQLHNFTNLGFKYYSISTVGDEDRCQTCKEMEGKKLEVADAHVGINCPPFHDLCRCTICPKV